VDVVVVGAGIVGLTSAIRLREAGAEVRVVTADAPGDTVSAVAAAVWYPTRTDADPRVLEWGIRTYAVFAAEAAAGVPGVVMRPTRMIVRHRPSGPPWWAPAVPDFAQAGHGEWRFTVPAVEMVPYLDHLVARFRDAGGTVERRRVESLGEDGGTVVNATGLAARELADDPRVFPVRGQVVVVDNPGLTTSIRDEDHPDGAVYIHPRSDDVVLGGTFDEGDDDTAVRPETAEAILRRTAAVEPRLHGATVRRHLVGLRPARRGGPRVERDGTIIHAYGHGGAGMTLSWGCAEEVARLAGHTPSEATRTT